MAIAFVNYARVYGAGTSTTVNVTVPSGVDRALFVGVAQGSGTISSITCNGVAMTLVNTQVSTYRVSIYYTIAPSAGASATIAVAFSTTVAYGVVATNWTGVHQTAAVGTFAGASGTSTAPSVNVTSASGEVVLDIVTPWAGLSAVGSGQTLISPTAWGASAAGSSYEAGAASVTMSWTSGNGLWVIGGVPIKPSTSTSPTVSAGVTVGEMRITPLRAAPSGFSQQSDTVLARIENQSAAWEASAMFPKLLQGTIQPDGSLIWDDIMTIPSVGAAGEIEITSLPTRLSPNGSLVITTQDLFTVYPLPFGNETHLIPYPDFARSRSDASVTTPAPPVFYPSTWDGGDSLFELHGIHVIAENLTEGTDGIGISWRGDDTNPWEKVQWASQNDSFFPIETPYPFTKLTLAISIYDAVNTDPVGPQIRSVVAWVKELTEQEAGRRPKRSRSLPEVS